ncbi:Acyl-CoA-binding domain-containing protein 5 [Papilio machaon]|uniref:Acyl-CoA-binding domain-containing protein 5 n=1 Tax=Papilio machaon TaxID=76193 RepID=A0A194R0A0_PAPMA|nr:Acyl-CoA-binding domain-containing protein 5 [Papilio machaon]
MSIEEKFNAAVNVIRSLPKSGSYQPSNELMLRFYSYYKQATEGPCDKPKPGFWDVVNRAKWESWNKLGNMTKDEAMQAYVDELHKIVETMSYNSDVASFLSLEEDDQNCLSNDLELVAGDVLARVRSVHNTPIGSRSVSGASSPIRSASPPRNRHDSDDEFIDTVDVSVEIFYRYSMKHKNKEPSFIGQPDRPPGTIPSGWLATLESSGSREFFCRALWNGLSSAVFPNQYDLGSFSRSERITFLKNGNAAFPLVLQMSMGLGSPWCSRR